MPSDFSYPQAANPFMNPYGGYGTFPQGPQAAQQPGMAAPPMQGYMPAQGPGMMGAPQGLAGMGAIPSANGYSTLGFLEGGGGNRGGGAGGPPQPPRPFPNQSMQSPVNPGLYRPPMGQPPAPPQGGAMMQPQRPMIQNPPNPTGAPAGGGYANPAAFGYGPPPQRY